MNTKPYKYGALRREIGSQAIRVFDTQRRVFGVSNSEPSTMVVFSGALRLRRCNAFDVDIFALSGIETATHYVNRAAALDALQLTEVVGASCSCCSARVVRIGRGAYDADLISRVLRHASDRHIGIALPADRLLPIGLFGEDWIGSVAAYRVGHETQIGRLSMKRIPTSPTALAALRAKAGK